MIKRRVEVISSDGFKDGYEQYEFEDRTSFEEEKAKGFVANGWVKFIDGGFDDIEVIGTPDKPTLKIQYTEQKVKTSTIGVNTNG